jgi:hypothetical protein
MKLRRARRRQPAMHAIGGASLSGHPDRGHVRQHVQQLRRDIARPGQQWLGVSSSLKSLNQTLAVASLEYVVIETADDDVVTPYANAFLPAAANVHTAPQRGYRRPRGRRRYGARAALRGGR